MILAMMWLVIGFSLLGFAGYEYVYKGNTPGQLAWIRPNGPAPGADGQLPPGAEVVGTESFRLVMDKIGVDAPVSAYGVDENQVPEVPYEAQLVAWYNFSAYPGNGDNAVFAGHVTWRGDAVFKRLSEMQPGDHVEIQRQDGSHLVYEITDSLTVAPTDQDAQHWMLPTGADTITIITCAGERVLVPGPIGAEYDHRQVLRGVLIAVA
ncbi:MAG: class F sortase [Dehalococcoidia bacterium]